MATRVADFVLIQDHQSVIGDLPPAEQTRVVFPNFNAPGAIGNQAVLAFRVVARFDPRLHVTLNGAVLIDELHLQGQEGGTGAPPDKPRTIHEVLSQTELREEGNQLAMSTKEEDFATGVAWISDVVLWYRRLA